MSPDAPVEVEIKARADDLEAIRDELKARGATHQASRHQADTYFDHPTRSFADTDEAFRIRRTDDDVELTYKGPKLDEATKTRQEIDLTIDDPEAAQAMLEQLGFKQAGRVVKHREVYELDSLTVVLDRVEGLGDFVEIETVVEDDVDAARKSVLELASELGLEDQTRRSYLGLVLDDQASGAA